MLSTAVLELLDAQLTFAKSVWAKDRARNLSGVSVPQTVAQLSPSAGQAWPW